MVQGRLRTFHGTTCCTTTTTTTTTTASTTTRYFQFQELGRCQHQALCMQTMCRQQQQQQVAERGCMKHEMQKTTEVQYNQIHIIYNLHFTVHLCLQLIVHFVPHFDLPLPLPTLPKMLNFSCSVLLFTSFAARYFLQCCLSRFIGRESRIIHDQ